MGGAPSLARGGSRIRYSGAISAAPRPNGQLDIPGDRGHQAPSSAPHGNFGARPRTWPQPQMSRERFLQVSLKGNRSARDIPSEPLCGRHLGAYEPDCRGRRWAPHKGHQKVETNFSFAYFFVILRAVGPWADEGNIDARLRTRSWY